MKKLLYPICVWVLLLSACAKKATPDRILCDCFDKETADYVAEHPNLTTDDLATAKETIGTPCLAEFEKEYPEAERKELDKQYTKEEGDAMIERMKLCGANLEITLQKVIDKNAAAVSKTTNASESQDSLDFMADDAADRADVSGTDCEDFLDKYEDYADSYAVVATKYARNPTDMSIVTEYSDMATKAQEMEQTKPDDCQTDEAFMKRYSRITAKVTSAAAVQMQGSAKMLEQMSK